MHCRSTHPARWSLRFAVPAAVVVIAAVGCGGGSKPSATAQRRAEVEARGAQVMPFDQDRTTHVFRKTAAGGIQTVVAKQADDRKEIGLVRSHLRVEAKRFSVGNFSDPMAIHGMEMPGLAALRAGATRIRVRYSSVAAGARIAYATGDSALIGALHAWFDAQLMDHGAHAHA